jgi:hypothetical protein
MSLFLLSFTNSRALIFVQSWWVDLAKRRRVWLPREASNYSRGLIQTQMLWDEGRGGPRMRRPTIHRIATSIASTVLLCCLSVGCVWKSDYEMLEAQLRQLQSGNAQLERQTALQVQQASAERGQMLGQLQQAGNAAQAAQQQTAFCSQQLAQVANTAAQARRKIEEATQLLTRVVGASTPSQYPPGPPMPSVPMYGPPPQQ